MMTGVFAGTKEIHKHCFQIVFLHPKVRINKIMYHMGRPLLNIVDRILKLRFQQEDKNGEKETYHSHVFDFALI